MEKEKEEREKERGFELIQRVKENTNRVSYYKAKGAQVLH